ncbi:MAG: hypothetical protein ABH803_02065, partial [Candidatus Micrarchaeota archaeon]
MEGNKHKENINNKIWIAIAILGIACFAVGFVASNALNPQTETLGGNETTLNENALQQEVSDYLNDLIVLQGAEGVSINAVSTEQKNGMYAINFEINQDGELVQEGTAFISPDGKQLFLSAPLDLTEALP